MNYNSIGTKCIIKPYKALFFALLFPIILLALLAICTPAHSQDVKPADKVLKDTVIASKTYKLYVGSRGGRYVVRTAKSGKVYKQYFKSK